MPYQFSCFQATQPRIKAGRSHTTRRLGFLVSVIALSSGPVSLAKNRNGRHSGSAHLRAGRRTAIRQNCSRTSAMKPTTQERRCRKLRPISLEARLDRVVFASAFGVAFEVVHV